MFISPIALALPSIDTADRWKEYQEMMERDPAEGAKRSVELRNQCICPDCPTYTDCAKQRGESFFCALNAGRSDCITEENWCICETCPVTERIGLTKIYYCIKGNESEQRTSP
jgi:Protein of unknown function (DUF2769)